MAAVGPKVLSALDEAILVKYLKLAQVERKRAIGGVEGFFSEQVELMYVWGNAMIGALLTHRRPAMYRRYDVDGFHVFYGSSIWWGACTRLDM